MENILKYYEFSDFSKDRSGTFHDHEIAYTALNETHFLVFEKEEDQFHLHVAKYASEQEIGQQPPEIVELVVANYDKSIPEHRIALRRYLE